MAQYISKNNFYVTSAYPSNTVTARSVATGIAEHIPGKRDAGANQTWAIADTPQGADTHTITRPIQTRQSTYPARFGTVGRNRSPQWKPTQKGSWTEPRTCILRSNSAKYCVSAALFLCPFWQIIQKWFIPFPIFHKPNWRGNFQNSVHETRFRENFCGLLEI